jgi:hypothetical protein
MQTEAYNIIQPQLTARTHIILMIDDNVQVRSMFARYILQSCATQNLTCAIYRLGQRAEPSLTYYHPTESDRPIVDFAVYEAASAHHALKWLKTTDVRRLTIISDVIMPLDTEVGLEGLLYGLREMQIAVNLLFVSGEEQNSEYVRNLLENQPAFFVVKGSDMWNRLPTAVVSEADRFRYVVLPRTGSRRAEFAVSEYHEQGFWGRMFGIQQI